MFQVPCFKFQEIMFKFQVIKILIVLVIFFVLPFFVSAWDIGDPIVPCGTSKTPSCNFCHFVTLADNLVQFALKVLILPAGTIALIIAGILFLTAGGNPQQLEKGKSIFKFAVIGILIAFGAWLIVDTILGNLLKTGYLPWTTFPGC